MYLKCDYYLTHFTCELTLIWTAHFICAMMAVVSIASSHITGPGAQRS